MQSAESYQQQADALRRRIREVSEAIRNCTDQTERFRQTERKRILTDMYRETLDALERMRPPQEKKRKVSKKPMHLKVGFDFFESARCVWADIDGTPWEDLERIANTGTSPQRARLLAALNSAMTNLTPRQAQVIGMSYNDQMTQQEIAERLGVNSSTVSRTLRNGLNKLQSGMMDRLLAERCVDENGQFDYCKFAEQSSALTDRQREYLYLLLSDDARIRDIAEWMNRVPSTVYRVNDRIIARLSGIAHDLPYRPSSIKISASDWEGLSEKVLCERLGVAPAVYYRMSCGQVGGMPRLHYEILRLHEDGRDVREIASQLRCGKDTVQRVLRKYPGVDLTDIPQPEPYRPRQVRKRSDADIAGMLRTAGDHATIGDSVDNLTYRKMMEMASVSSK